MASLATSGSGTLDQSAKHIPLFCSVCPDNPRFSDVSHLLTHIASKGHLHHETQTKLRSRQDMAASIALQDYEKWYRDNGIEDLLVERLKAKQVKEAARNKRIRGAIPPQLSPAKVCISIRSSGPDCPMAECLRSIPRGIPREEQVIPSLRQRNMTFLVIITSSLAPTPRTVTLIIPKGSCV